MSSAARRIIDEDVQQILRADLPWEQLDGRTVLISGAGGLVPAYLVHVLMSLQQAPTNLSCRVIGLVRNRARASQRLGRWLDHPQLTLLEQDIREPLAEDIRADMMIHAASPASPKLFGTDPAGTLVANVLGTWHLLERARVTGVSRFLFVSSGEVYGQVAPEQIPTGELDYGWLDPASVRSCYAESKRLAETMCVSWQSQHGIPTVIARPFHTYGPGLDFADGRIFADFVGAVVERRELVLHSDGSAQRAFCYLTDAIHGLFTVLLKGAAGQAYNVGNEAGELSIRKLAELLQSLYPDRVPGIRCQERPAHEGYLPSPILRNCPATGKLRALGWQPTTCPAVGFRRTVESFL